MTTTTEDVMPVKIDKASIIKAAGTKEKIIREIFEHSKLKIIILVMSCK